MRTNLSNSVYVIRLGIPGSDPSSPRHRRRLRSIIVCVVVIVVAIHGWTIVNSLPQNNSVAIEHTTEHARATLDRKFHFAPSEEKRTYTFWKSFI